MEKKNYPVFFISRIPTSPRRCALPLSNSTRLHGYVCTLQVYQSSFFDGRIVGFAGISHSE